MAVPYKKIARKDPRKADAIEKFYPQLVTLGQSASLESIAYEMKEKSSLSLGDIKSVLTNFVEAMRTSLYNGQSVNIRDFGVFSLSARTKGVDAEKDCTAKNIMAVKINFRPSSSVRPNLTSTGPVTESSLSTSKRHWKERKREKTVTETLWMTRRHKSESHERRCRKMKKSNWNTILKVMIAVASAILGVLGGNAMNL